LFHSEKQPFLNIAIPIANLSLNPFQVSLPMQSTDSVRDSVSLLDSISKHLARDQYVAGESIQVEINEGEIVLCGAVPSYFQKQMAQHAVRPFAGPGKIRNTLKVIPVQTLSAR
jgi:osmotically-inducible protein OsmY